MFYVRSRNVFRLQGQALFLTYAFLAPKSGHFGPSAEAGEGGLDEATSKLIRGLLEVLILDSIAHEPKHGYALIQELEQLFGAPPNRNQVYPMLIRLEQDGFLRADRTGGRGKTRYALTGKGLELLKEYRVRSPEFRARVAALWFPEAYAPTGASTPGLPPAEGTRPHLVDRLAPAEDIAPRAAPATAPAPAPPPGRGHAGQACTAEVALRRRAAGDRVSVDATGLDPACPTCQGLLGDLRALRERWF